MTFLLNIENNLFLIFYCNNKPLIFLFFIYESNKSSKI